MLTNKMLRNYKMNIDEKLLKNEHIIISNNKLKKLLDGTRSTATINTYLYICLKVNKSKDIGNLRNIRCRDISLDLGIPLSTVQDSIKTLTQTNYIDRKFNLDKSSDYKVVGYKNILSKAYTKIPASLVLNDTFLQSSKDEVSAMLSVFSSVFAHAVASMKKLQGVSFLKDKQNYQLIGQAQRDRVFSKQTLLSKIKRISNKDLDRVLDKLQVLGLSVKSIFRKGIDKTKNYIIGIDENILSGLFRPFINTSPKTTNPLAFNTVSNILCDTGLDRYIKSENHEDLTQMYIEYGDLFFSAGIVAIQKVVYDNYALTDEDGGRIENVCAYFRTSVETFIEKCRSKK